MSVYKKFVVYLKFILTIVLLRSYGKIIHDFAQKYQGKISLSDFRTYEKLSVKKRKADLDVAFLKNCQALGVFPKFVCLPLANVDNKDTIAIRKRLLRSAIIKRSREQRQLNNNLTTKEREIKENLSPMDWMLLASALKKNVTKRLEKAAETHSKKLKHLTKNKTLPFSHNETVINLSSHQLKQEELDILKNGLTFSIKPPRLNASDILTTFEQIHYAMKAKLKKPEDHARLKIELAYIAQTYVSSYRPTKRDIKRYNIIRNIKNNKNIIISRPDKGNGVVILDRQSYLESCYDIINDSSKFTRLTHNPTLSREARLQRLLRKLRKQGSLDDITYDKIFPRGSQPARFYGLPKLHKQRENHSKPPLRPIISSINTYNYKLAKYLCSLLNPLISTDHTTKDSFSFVEEFHNFSSNINNKFLISYDVQSLYTNIPLNETIDIAINLIFDTYPNFSINRKDLTELFLIATSQTHFLFNDCYYDQTDGVSMGSPLAPVLANLFMSFHERRWLQNYDGPNVLFYRRYVDDTFCIFENEHDALLFFNYINHQHPNIKFTYETEKNEKLPFLDILITKHSNQYTTSVFHKNTYTGLLTNFLSFTPLRYKIGLINTLLDRIRKINNTDSGFQQDVKQLTTTLKRNLFPPHLIDKVIKTFNRRNTTNTTTNINNAPTNEDNSTRYFKLPYTGFYSQITQRKLQSLIKQFCNNLDIKLAFSSFKIKNLFSLKDSVPEDLKSCVVYQFTCAGCNSSYIGETTRHLSTRIKEHTQTDKSSHIFKHLQHSSLCKNHYTRECFKLLDKANFPIALKIKESLYIKKLKPELNVQVQHINTILSL